MTHIFLGQILSNGIVVLEGTYTHSCARHRKRAPQTAEPAHVPPAVPMTPHTGRRGPAVVFINFGILARFLILPI